MRAHAPAVPLLAASDQRQACGSGAAGAPSRSLPPSGWAAGKRAGSVRRDDEDSRMLLVCILAPALVLPAPGRQLANQAHPASARAQACMRLALNHALLR